jgi:hypothetical protein
MLPAGGTECYYKTLILITTNLNIISNKNIIMDEKEFTKQDLIDFISWVDSGYNFEENAEKIVNEYLKEKENDKIHKK